MRDSDLIIIGAGPAGMAAAAEAARHGLAVTLLDEQPRPGGQIYRDVERAAPRRGGMLGADYLHGRSLAAALRGPGITCIAGAVVWEIEEGFVVSYSRGGRAGQARGARLLLATGALERAMPVPGWTLPGVMGAGAAQILLKQSGIVPQGAVLAGSGPLLYLVAAQMLRAGAAPLALVETQARADLAGALSRRLGGALRGWRHLARGAAMLARIHRAGVPRFTAAREIAVEGEERVEAIRFASGDRTRRIACRTVLLHHGVVPHTQAARTLGVGHRWEARQRAFAPVLDAWGETDVPGVFIAGDAAGIGGASAAETAGRLAALKIAADLGRIEAARRDAEAAPLRRRLNREMAVRPFLDAAYPPFGAALAPADGTIVCRCEEVTAGQIRAAARLGSLGPNQAKAFTRAGMGPCQGRYCGLTVTELLSVANGRTQDETGYQRIRPPLKPVTLAELAAMAEGDERGLEWQLGEEAQEERET